MKKINLDSKKFNFLLERMNKNNTLYEVESKSILLESTIDDIIKAARRVPTDINLPTQVIRILDTSLDEFVTDVNKILISLKTGLNDLSSLKNTLKVEDMISSTKKWRSHLSKVVDQINLGQTLNALEVKRGIFDFMSGKIEFLPDSVLRELNANQISMINKYKFLTQEFNDFIITLEKLQKITKKVESNNSLDDLIGELLSESGIVNLDDIKKVFNDLEDYMKRYPDDEISDIYEVFKKKYNIGNRNSDEIIESFKRLLRDNPIYKTLDLNLKKKIVSWFRKKLLNRVDEINFELGKKVDWDNSLIYYNKSEDSFYIITTKNKKELDEVYAQITDQGFKPRKTDGSEGSKGFDLSDISEKEKGAEYEKGRRGEVLRFRLMAWGIPIVLVGGAAVTYCYYRFNTLRDKEKLDASTIRNKEEERGFFGVLTSCIAGTSKEALEISIKAGESIFKNDILPEMALIEGTVNIWLDEKCGRSDSRRENGKPVSRCTKCLDCEKDLDKESVKKLKVKGANGKDVEVGKVFSNIELFLKPEHLMPENPQNYKDLIKKIKEDGDNEVINAFLTKDGTAVPLDEMLVIICNQHSKQCTAEQFNIVMSDIIEGSKNQDCDTYDSFMDEKINILKEYDQRGLLSWGSETEKTVDISVNSSGEKLSSFKTGDGNTPFNGVNSVSQFLNRLEEFKINTKRFVCEKSDIVVDEEEQNLLNSSKPIDLMKELWESGEVKLECPQWKNDLVSSKKSKMKITMGSVFNDYFSKVFPDIDWYGSEWEEAFNYWWDKQRFLCKISN
jgi:hypothetical protein